MSPEETGLGPFNQILSDYPRELSFVQTRARILNEVGLSFHLLTVSLPVFSLRCSGLHPERWLGRKYSSC